MRKKSKTIYSNAHAIVRKKQSIQNVFDSFKTLYPTDKQAMSVLMLGIDSISRLNLIRSMPMTAQYLYDTGWFELKGYNKVSLSFTPVTFSFSKNIHNFPSFHSLFFRIRYRWMTTRFPI
jgi:hypothetical protein